jgi:hypothetical protein
VIGEWGKFIKCLKCLTCQPIHPPEEGRLEYLKFIE